MSVRCPKCEAENPETKPFCGDCGTQLTPPKKGPWELTETIDSPLRELTRGTTFARRYEIIEELGKGGMGKVYRVFDKKIEEEVALKLIKPEIAADNETIRRFSNELKLARKIAHRNVCKMYELLEDEGTHFITMEYVPGQDLRGLIRQTGQLTAGKAIAIARQISEGLSEAHRLGVVHRDLKPGNVMIDKEGNARIMDFGIARSLGAKAITGAGVMIGTPEYMSPEQVEGKDTDERSDIYSLGIILYEMLAGRVPFSGDAPFAIGLKQKSETPRDPKELNPQIPGDLSQVILKCLEKEREKRYQSPQELQTELEKIEKGIPIAERIVVSRKPVTSREITVKFRPKNFLAPALVIVLIAIAALAIRQIIRKKEIPATVSARKSIAVLPFVDLSPAKDYEYFCDGMAETLINALIRIEGLWVPARTSAFSFKGKEEDVQDIGRKLNVENVLEGSVQVAGDQLRVTARISSAQDSRQLWSEIFDRKIDDIFSIQDEIAQAVVDKLELALLGEQKSKLIKHATSDVTAYETYLKGKYYRYTERPNDILKARDYFEEAIRKDPRYATAFAGLAESYMLLGLGATRPRNEAAANALSAAQKALDLDENLSEARVSIGVIKMVFDWDWKGAEEELEKAVSLNPNNFDAFFEYGWLLFRTYRREEAEKAWVRGRAIDPLNPLILRQLRILYMCTGQEAKAEDLKRQLLEIRPDWAEWGGTNYYSVERASQEIQVQGRNPMYMGALAIAYIKSGNGGEAAKLAAELTALYEKGHEGNVAVELAQISYALGENEKALDWLERAVAEKAPGLINLSICTQFQSLQEDPRFLAVLKRVGLK